MVVLYCYFSLDPYFSEPVGQELSMIILDLAHYMAYVAGTEPPEFPPQHLTVMMYTKLGCIPQHTVTSNYWLPRLLQRCLTKITARNPNIFIPWNMASAINCGCLSLTPYTSIHYATQSKILPICLKNGSISNSCEQNNNHLE